MDDAVAQEPPEIAPGGRALSPRTTSILSRGMPQPAQQLNDCPTAS